MLNSSVLDLYNLIDSHILAEERIPIILFLNLKLHCNFQGVIITPLVGLI